jgi:hypothetical protein
LFYKSDGIGLERQTEIKGDRKKEEHVCKQRGREREREREKIK